MFFLSLGFTYLFFKPLEFLSCYSIITALLCLVTPPIWFALDNLTLCGRSNHRSMVLLAIKENFRCAEAFLLRTGPLFLLFSSKIETSCQQNKQSSLTRDTVWHEIFAGSNFCDFSSDPQNLVPQKKLRQNRAIYRRKNKTRLT